jgi:acyl carrier protein
MKITTKKILKKIFRKKTDININSDINSIYMWDSLNHLKLVSEIEKTIKKKLTIKQVLQLTSVIYIDNLIKKNEKKI